MRFYTKVHTHYCGIDLHARWMYVCVLDQQCETLLHRNLRARPETFLKAMEPFRQDLVVAVECMFTWYWLADLCAEQSVEFILGHALYMKAIHGGKAKNAYPDPDCVIRNRLPLFCFSCTPVKCFFLAQGVLISVRPIFSK